MEATVTQLREILSRKLPGFKAHKQMIPEGRVYQKRASNPKKSAVNIVTYLYNNELCFVLTQRAKKMEYHSGQISLPGGSKDDEDKNLWETAKRETFEEIGIEITDENYIGKLTPLYIDVSNFMVYPFVSFLKKKPILKGNKTEVEKIYEVNFMEFFDPKNKYFSSIQLKEKKINFPYFELEGQEVWGATAMILQEFFEIFKKLYSF